MIKKIKLSFKRHPKETGLRGIGRPYSIVDIKINKKICGHIFPPTWQDENHVWKIMISVIKNDIMEDGNKNCSWKWFTLSFRGNDENECREHIKQEIQKIESKYNIYYIEEEE